MTPESHRYYRYYTFVKPILDSKAAKTYGGPIFTLIAIGIFIVFAIKPTVETISDLQKKIEEYKQANEAITKKSDDLSKARANYKNLDPQVRTLITEKIPNNNPNIRELIQALEQTAQENQASISALQIQPLEINAPNPNKVPSELTEVGFTFNVEGNYNQVINMLNTLANNTRILSIDKLNVNKLQSGNNLFMAIKGKAYYLK